MTEVEDNRPISSKEIKVDKNLILSNAKHELKKIIADSVKPIKTVKEKVDKMNKLLEMPISFPSNYVFATISSRVYDVEKQSERANAQDRHGEAEYAEIANWILLTVGYNSDLVNGYCGAAYWNSDSQQVIIAHCGTKNLGGLFNNFFGVLKNQHVPQIDSAVTFADDIISVLKEINEERGSNIQLFFTGHSLGAWLACITAFSAKFLQREQDYFVSNLHSEGGGYHSSTVIFDGPGCKEMLERIQNRVMDRYGPSLPSLDITNYLSAPNIVNTCNQQVGDVYRLFINVNCEGRDELHQRNENAVLNFLEKQIVDHTMKMHNIESIRAVFDPETGDVLEVNGNLRIRRVKDWPQLVQSLEKEGIQYELDRYFEKAIKHLVGLAAKAEGDVGFSILLDIDNLYDTAKWYKGFLGELEKFLSAANESNNYEPERYFNPEGIFREIRYKTESLNRNYKETHKQSVFTKDELKFLEQYKDLEMYADLVNLKGVFDSFKEEENLRIYAMKVLKGCRIINEVIQSTNVQESIVFIKTLFHLFPEIVQKVSELYQLLPSDIISKMHYQRLSQKYLARFEDKFKITLDFVEDTLSLKAFLNDASKKILHLTNSCTAIEVERTRKTFKMVCKDCHGYEKQDIFLNLDEILGDDGFNSYLKKCDFKCLLCIECEETLHSETEENFFRELLTTVQASSSGSECNLKLILITKKESNIGNFVRNHFKNGESIYQENGEDVLFEYLTSESREKLLEKMVLFQGKKVHFGEVVKGCTRLNSIMSPVTMAELSQDILIKIGTPLPKLGPTGHYYMDRQLVQRVKVNDKILQDDKLSPSIQAIAISSSSEGDVSRSIKRIKGNKKGVSNSIHTLNKGNEEADFKTMCSKCRNVHWLEQKTCGLIWKRSYGKSIGMLQKYLENYDGSLKEEDYSHENCSIKLVDFDDINKFQEKVVIIAAEPGMGKTTAFTQLGMKWLASDARYSQWLIRINLAEYKLQLKSKEFESALDIIDFSFDNNVSQPTKELLKSRLTESGEVVFLVDGFDEITQKGQKHIVNLLKLLLKNTKVERVFISTRLHLREKLENSFSTIAYTFRPFSRKDQVEFLKKFWKEDFNPAINERNQEDLINELLYGISKSIGDVTAQFMGIPLQMRMVAECFRDNIRNDTLKDDLSTRNFNILELYNRFIHVKFSEFFKKLGVETLTLDFYDNIEENWFAKALIKAHRALACKALLPKRNPFGKISLSEKDKHLINSMGIVQIINDAPKFIHKTFAEYYVASTMAHSLSKRKGSSKYKYIKKILKEHLYDENNYVIRIFFDYRLAKEDDLLLAALERKWDDFHKILTNDPHRISRKDALGRDARYYWALADPDEYKIKLQSYEFNCEYEDDLENTLEYYEKIGQSLKPYFETWTARSDVSADRIAFHSDQAGCSAEYMPESEDMEPPFKKRKNN